MPLDIPVPSLNFSDWNVYSCLWTTDKIQIFLNGVMIREIINDCATVDLNYPMEVLFDTYIDFPGFPLPSVDDALMVKHFMAYKLITICDSYAYHGDFSTYAYGVHKDLRIDGPSNVPVGSAVTLRAGTTVVNGLFTVPAGAEFCIMPTTCY
jgi:hypothetical protein